MSAFALRVSSPSPYAEAVDLVRDALSEEGFGVLSEIDVAATLKAKLAVDVPPQLILGACNPPLAHRALQVEPSLGVLLPCNVVVRVGDDGITLVEAVDPAALVSATGNTELAPVAADARARLSRALDRVATGDQPLDAG